ncbi:MAG: hypothetical protein C0483_15410 [Pirellula sp.]|nr:hypothetical protein [Pirellula sp.]
MRREILSIVSIASTTSDLRVAATHVASSPAVQAGAVPAAQVQSEPVHPVPAHPVPAQTVQKQAAKPSPPVYVAEVVYEASVAPPAPVLITSHDEPLARRRTLSSLGLGAWLWHIRYALTAGSLSGVTHCVALVTLGVVLLDAKITPPQQTPPLEVSVPVQKLLDKVEPPVITALEADKPSFRSDGRSTGSGSGSAGASGGRGGELVGGVQVAALTPNAAQTTNSGGTGFGIDRAYGNDMLGEVGEMKKEATFFGVKAEGRSFAFVVDTSGSMGINNRYLRCRAELLRAVSELGHKQKYFITFFNHQTFAMPERKLVEATSPQLKKTMQWITGAVPMGSTEPWDGVYLALKLKPDAIFLLTDGEFNPEVVRKILGAQPDDKKRIPIHTIGFESTAGEVTLQTIARETGGKYLYVP